MTGEIIDSTSNKEFEKFAEGTFLSVGFLNRNSIMPIVELFNEYFEKKNKADEKTASKMVHEFDLSLKKNLDYQQQQQQHKQQQDKKNQERAERQSRAYEEQRKEMSEATKNISKGAKKTLAVVAKGAEVVKDIATTSFQAQQKFTKSLQSMDSAGVFLKNGFVDITSIIQNTGWAFDDVAQLVAKSSQTIARFANTTSNGTEVLEKMYADIPNHLNITSDEFTSMASSFMKYRTNNDINNKQFQNDWKTYYNNMKLFSRVLGVSIENLEQQNNLQAQNNAVKSLQLKKSDFVKLLRIMGINDEMIAGYATGGLVNSKQLALSQGNEVGRLLFKELNGKLDNMSVEDLYKLAPRLAEAAERTIEMQKNMTPSERAVATKSEEYAMLKGMNINQETLLKWAQNLKNTPEHQQILSNEQHSTSKLFEQGAGARKEQNKLEAKKLEVTAGTIESATVTLMGIKAGYKAMNASLVAVDKTFTNFTDKLSDIISKITGIDKDKVENGVNTAAGFLKSALAVAVPYIGYAATTALTKYVGKKIFSKKNPKNGPSKTNDKKPKTKNTGDKKSNPKNKSDNKKSDKTQKNKSKSKQSNDTGRNRGRNTSRNTSTKPPKTKPSMLTKMKDFFKESLPKAKQGLKSGVNATKNFAQKASPYLKKGLKFAKPLAKKGIPFLDVFFSGKELYDDGADSWLQRRREGMKGWDYIDPLRYMEEMALKMKVDKGAEWIVNKTMDAFGPSRKELSTIQSVEQMKKNGSLKTVDKRALALAKGTMTNDEIKAYFAELEEKQKRTRFDSGVPDIKKNFLSVVKDTKTPEELKELNEQLNKKYIPQVKKKEPPRKKRYFLNDKEVSEEEFYRRGAWVDGWLERDVRLGEADKKGLIKNGRDVTYNGTQFRVPPQKYWEHYSENERRKFELVLLDKDVEIERAKLELESRRLEASRGKYKEFTPNEKEKRQQDIERQKFELFDTQVAILTELQKIASNTDGTNKNMEKIAENDKKNSLTPTYNQR